MAAPEVPLSERPLSSLTDHEIASLTSSLRDAHSSLSPLISPLLPLASLASEYANAAPVFRGKIARLGADGWRGLRRTRGNGDCFYAALLFGWLEGFVGEAAEGRESAWKKVEGLLPLLETVGFQPDITEDFYAPLRTLLSSPFSLAALEESMNDPEFNACSIVFLRLVTSAWLKTHEDDFAPFLFALEDDPRFFEGGAPTLEQFCGHYVEPVGKEADHIAISALTRALSLHVRIAYLDQSASSGEDGVDFHVFEETSAEGLQCALLYRPGHYDCLYR